jgi:hypothetical protein
MQGGLVEIDLKRGTSIRRCSLNSTKVGESWQKQIKDSLQMHICDLKKEWLPKKDDKKKSEKGNVKSDKLSDVQNTMLNPERRGQRRSYMRGADLLDITAPLPQADIGGMQEEYRSMPISPYPFPFTSKHANVCPLVIYCTALSAASITATTCAALYLNERPTPARWWIYLRDA